MTTTTPSPRAASGHPADDTGGRTPGRPAGGAIEAPRPAASLVSARIAGLSLSAPYAVPARQPGPDFVNLVSGAPAVEALPLREIREVTNELFSQFGSGGRALAYGANAGDRGLRDLIAASEGVDVERILITNGALHGTSLALQVVAEPGDVIVVDDPVFPDTIRVVESTGADIHTVPVGPRGFDVEVLADRLRAGLRPKAVYTVPDFHNPGGGLLPYDRRLRLVELAEHYGFVIVSDNPYRQFAFDGTREPDFPLGSDRVVVAHTFAKTLGPGLRLGWLVAPEWLAPHVVNLRRRYDFQSSTLSQAIARALLERPGWFDGLLRRGRALYRARADLAVRALQEAGDRLEFTAPEGGFFVWARVTGGPEAAELLADRALAAGVVYSKGTFYDPHQSGRYADHLRLAFSAPQEAHLVAGLERLTSVVKSLP
ncbi:PLP-dependent aminotransferase family protein [Actinacidiphila sp. ITFR-21]|uniref:aminotransferase-like domain-containing protein n=1 Tax=Actinacidiphila sp. ITFR-21 TaxID=3075199 RepID=UPI00288936D1|nr:PLP-dependent aminotransferase family protein [Streptomyces sp. ITFR-21]WNI17242.1 PLP-dependent aminotransferase family protein [Streptomyces sp. ITFR-21]